MTLNKDEKEHEIVVNAEPDATMVTAVGVEEKKNEGGVGVSAAGGPGNEPPIPAGHSRFYCSKCRSVSCLLLLDICKKNTCVGCVKWLQLKLCRVK